jgi:hypothetical protein
MITAGEHANALEEFLEQVIEKLEELAAARQELKVSVPAQEPPIVNVEAPARPRAWIFRIHRDAEGFIETVIATPKF